MIRTGFPIRDRISRLEPADGGTLFLDEVGEIPLDLPSKLLRVLQEGELERVGDATTRRARVTALISRPAALGSSWRSRPRPGPRAHSPQCP